MADRKAVKKKKKAFSGEGDGPTKDETEIAKYMRFNMPTKKAAMYGDEVFYFWGSKAVNFLLDSKWASSSKSSVVFTHRESVVAFLSRLMSYNMFNRVHLTKIEKKVKDKKKDTKPEEKESKEPGSPKREGKKVKKKVKITLEPHEQQIFLDSDDEVYVWIYDPISWKTFILGIFLVLGIIAVCLFPLWPENIREYSWYLSVAGAIFVGSILVLAVLRYVIYGALWLCTLGKLHFWLLPNLTAECGFFESFVPVYQYEFSEKSDKNIRKESDEGEIKVDDEKPGHMSAEELKQCDNKMQAESEESSGSFTKEEDWVKVKKGDAVENQDQKTEINC